MRRCFRRRRVGAHVVGIVDLRRRQAPHHRAVARLGRVPANTPGTAKATPFAPNPGVNCAASWSTHVTVSTSSHARYSRNVSAVVPSALALPPSPSVRVRAKYGHAVAQRRRAARAVVAAARICPSQRRSNPPSRRRTHNPAGRAQAARRSRARTRRRLHRTARPSRARPRSAPVRRPPSSLPRRAPSWPPAASPRSSARCSNWLTPRCCCRRATVAGGPPGGRNRWVWVVRAGRETWAAVAAATAARRVKDRGHAVRPQ